ncbi:MAG: hypothetical protein KJS97_04820 [Alphaproteobacteria bacterium]|nr:hypothetical protein [Alphaproteobacteria bacterium]
MTTSLRVARTFAGALLLSAATVLAAAPAFAAPVTVGTITYSADFQKMLEKKYGQREGEKLSADVRRYIERAVAGASAPTATRVDVEIVDAKPNRPTMKQMTDIPGLSMESIGIGGAALRATLRDASGAELRTVSYSWYESDIRDVMAASTWSDANRAIRWFSAQVKEAATGAPAKPES